MLDSKITFTRRRRNEAFRRWVGISSGDTDRRLTAISLLVGVVLLPALLFGIVAWQDRQSVLDVATQNIQSTARIFQENARNVFDTHELVARLVDERIRGMTWKQISESESLHQYLASMVHDFPKMQSLWLVDPSGILRGSSVLFPTPQIDLTDRDYFIFLSQQNADMFVGQPVHGRVLTEDIINVARRRSSASGHFDGVIVVSARPSYFTDFWKEISGAHDAMAILVRRDGMILARVPPANVNTPPLDTRSPLMRAIADADSGVYQGTSLLDGHQRIVAYDRIDRFAIYVAQGLPLVGILQVWHRHLLVYGTFFAFATLALVLLAVRANSKATSEAAAVRHWRETAQTLAEEAEQRAVIQAQLRQAQKMEAFGQLSGGIAHDFNNLLHVITGTMDILRRRVTARDEALVTLALESANRGKKMIESMLAFARQQPLQSEVFDLNDVIRDMESLFHPILGSGIELDMVLGATPCWVRSDRNQTELAILNLAINARDAMPNGGKLTVTVGCGQLAGEPAGLLGSFGTIAVKDVGTGMPPEVQARVFEPFFTTKGPSKGTGLGLSMVYGFTEQSRGSVTIDSVQGRGTTVTLYLPSEIPDGVTPVETSGSATDRPCFS